MPKKTITKFSVFVIFTTFASLFAGGCHSNANGRGEPPAFDQRSSLYDEPQIIGKFESDEITESSGIAASACQPDVIWTHNDSDNGAFLYALNLKGSHLGTWQVSNAKNFDWEDLALRRDANGKCYLYIGEIGNTKENERAEHKIYRILEPLVDESDSKSTKKSPKQTESAEVLTFRYSDARHDAETLLVHPVSGNIYVITKQRSGPSSVYKLKPDFDSTIVAKAEKLADLSVPAILSGLLTGGGIAPDGRRVIICDYFAGYEFVLPEGVGNLDEIWKQKPSVIALGDRKQGEAIGYSADGLSILATSEGKFSPLIEVKKRKQP